MGVVTRFRERAAAVSDAVLIWKERVCYLATTSTPLHPVMLHQHTRVGAATAAAATTPAHHRAYLLHQAAAALLVGCVWGATNPLIKQGSLAVEALVAQRRREHLPTWSCWLSPRLLLPWLANQSASLLFVALLGQSDISMAVPVANAVSIAANALVRGGTCGSRTHRARLA
jgi:hypothetical protein